MCVVQLTDCKKILLDTVCLMNGVGVLTVIVSANRAATEDGVRLRWLGTRACQNTKADISLLHISNRQVVCCSYFDV